jgi:hypothetical protein
MGTKFLCYAAQEECTRIFSRYGIVEKVRENMKGNTDAAVMEHEEGA